MAKTLGQCTTCGQKFKKARISGRRKGYKVLHMGEHSAKIKCKGCGKTGTVSP